MAFNLNTNIHALNARAEGTFTQNSLTDSLQRLSSGLRINKAADDASGMAIADSLRSQSNSLGQAIRNVNDGMGIIQIADKAMDEQVKILDSIKTKAIQAAQDGQTTKTRTAIQADIVRLVQSLDNIGNTTSYNGISLLAGTWTNKEFQVGAYSNTSIKASIGPTTSDKIGHVRVETGASISGMSIQKLEFLGVVGDKSAILESVRISMTAGTGVGALAEVINKNSDALGGVKASYIVETTSYNAISGVAAIKGLKINGVSIGDVTDIVDNDRDGKLINAINARKEETGVQASIDNYGRLHLTSMDGRGIYLQASSVRGYSNQPNANHANQNAKLADMFGLVGGDAAGTAMLGAAGAYFGGRLMLSKLDASDIRFQQENGAHNGLGVSAIGFGFSGRAGGAPITANATNNKAGQAETSVNLRKVLNSWNADMTSAIGANANNIVGTEYNNLGSSAGVTTLRGAMVVMSIAESAIKQLDSVRADLGSVQQQMLSTFNNITVTQVNVKAAESNIRETDFAEESSTYSKLNLLAQSGSYALSQANQVQQNIMRLLQ